MSETIEEKIKRLYKYIDEWAAPHHTHELIIQIRKELENKTILDNEHEKLLLDSMKKLLERTSSSPAYCECGHEMIAHVNFRNEMNSGCKGLTANKEPCSCSGFISNL